MTVNERLKILVKELGIKQAELAELWEVDRSLVSKILHGKSKIQVEMLQLIHIKYGVNLNWVFTGMGSMKKDDSQSSIQKFTEFMDMSDFQSKYIEVLEENRMINGRLIWYLDNCECKKDER